MIGAHTQSQHLTFGCVVDFAGVNSLTDSKLGEGCDGNYKEYSEMHPDFEEIDVFKLFECQLLSLRC